ncbi:hypothetical protein ACH4KU_05575 [Streptomyces althioticus]|uniref:hypothetical protein n=1 Tax=Streptomyces TaxID=1883 RepID=UPI0033D2D37E
MAPEKADLPAGAELVAGNLADTASLAGVFDGVTAAHLIAFGGDGFAPLANGAEIVAMAREAGVRRVTVLRGDVEKGCLERAVESGDLEWTYLSPVEFTSNTLEWAETVRSEGAEVPGRDVRFVELSRDAMVTQWHREGYSDEDIAFFLMMRTDPPEGVHGAADGREGDRRAGPLLRPVGAGERGGIRRLTA